MWMNARLTQTSAHHRPIVWTLMVPTIASVMRAMKETEGHAQVCFHLQLHVTLLTRVSMLFVSPVDTRSATFVNCQGIVWRLFYHLLTLALALVMSCH